jgi:hypothetical protein
MFGEFLYLHYCNRTAISRLHFEQSPIKKLERALHQVPRPYTYTDDSLRVDIG